MDEKPHRMYRLEWVAEPQNVMEGGYWKAHLEEVFMPHHITCPKRDEFRRKK